VRVADRAGLDLVTFQDHPYQPSFHETWTLLAYVASRTKNIHVSGNVLNLPLRQRRRQRACDRALRHRSGPRNA
jgi:alkanesulfonate monooxygenase SsuD/methylene tetrahydromethanopterin reductase-like flavin-dependent oxidoreductase (luciferase family)